MIDIDLELEINDEINRIGQKYFGTRLSKSDSVLISIIDDGDSWLNTYLITPNKKLWEFKMEVEKYLRTIRVCEIIVVTIKDPSSMMRELFVATSKIYDQEESFKKLSKVVEKRLLKRVE